MTTNTTNRSRHFAPLHAAATISKLATHETSDADLIEQIATGDRPAMQTLYTRHYDRIFRFVLRFGYAEPAVEDIVSDVFLDVWRNADRFEGRSQVSTWLLAIARNKSVEARRHRSIDQLDEDAMELVEDETDGPEAETQKHDTSSIIRKCVQQLSPAHRTIIDLVYFHEQTIDEAAKTIGVARSTAKTRAFYARQRLAELLAVEGVQAA